MGNLASKLYIDKLNFDNIASIYFLSTALSTGFFIVDYPVGAPILGTAAGLLFQTVVGAKESGDWQTDLPNQVAAAMAAAATALAAELGMLQLMLDGNETRLNAFLVRVIVAIFTGFMSYEGYMQTYTPDRPGQSSMIYERPLYWAMLAGSLMAAYFFYYRE